MTAAYSKFPPKRDDNSHIIKPRIKHNWSEYQKLIFKNLATDTDNLIIIARAGCSKTSSLVEGSRYIPKGKKTLFCAFNKHIQIELKARLPSACECSTLHALGFRGIKQRFGNVELDNRKCWKIVEEIIGNDNYDLTDNICQTVSFCKSNLVDSPEKIEELIAEYGIDLCDVEPKQFIDHVIRTLRICKERINVIDYNDMIWFCFVYRINVRFFDVCLLDEAQDISKGMLELALSTIKPGGRVIAVLDDRQAIYSFMGADSKMLGNLRTRLTPKELKLPICYRCPKKVITLCQTLVPDILPYDNAIEGEINEIDFVEMQKLIKPGHVLLSRLNAPLIKWTMTFLKNGIPANMLGRDIGDGLNYMIKKSKKKKVLELLKWLDNWEKTEKAAMLVKYPKANTEIITDKAECIRMLCDGATTIDQVKKNIDNLFQDGDVKKIILASSIHKYKGKENDVVFVLHDTLRSHNEEELNIAYISFSRAKTHLYLVKKEPNKPQ